MYTGGAVTIDTADLVVDTSTIGRRVVSVRLRNHTNEAIGPVGGFRVVLQNLAGGNLPGQDIRPGVVAGSIAGTGLAGSVDGIARSATVQPTAVAAFGPGSVAFGEATRVRLLRNGTVSTLRNGVGNVGGIVYLIDPSGRNEFAVFTERTNHRVQIINLSSGSLSTFSGSGVAGDAIGTPAATQFNTPIGLAVESSTPTGGALLVMDSGNNKVKRLPFTWNGGAPVPQTTSTRYSSVPGHAVAVSPSGSVAISDPAGHRVRIFPGGGSNSVTLGTGTAGTTVGLGNTAQFSAPTGLAYIGETAYVHSPTGNYVQYITPVPGGVPIQPSNWLVGYALGDGNSGFADGPGTSARLSNTAQGLASFGGNLFVADTGNFRIRDITSPGGRVDFGLPASFTSDEPVSLASKTGDLPPSGVFQQPHPFVTIPDAIPARGTLDLPPFEFTVPASVTRFSFTLQIEADTTNPVTPDGVINASAPGPGSPNSFVRNLIPFSPFPSDGPRGRASLGGVAGISFDAGGNMFWADTTTVRRMDAGTGRVQTIAGSLTSSGTVDGIGPVARFSFLRDLSISADGRNIYVVQANHVVRLIRLIDRDPADPGSWQVVTIGGVAGTSGNVYGNGDVARLNTPTSVVTNDDGSILYVSEGSPSIRRIVRNGTGTTSADFFHTTFLNTGQPSVGDLGWSGGPYFAYIVTVSGEPRIVGIDLNNFSSTVAVAFGANDTDQPVAAFGVQNIALDPQGQLTFVSRSDASSGQFKLRRKLSVTSTTAYTLVGGGAALGDTTADRVDMAGGTFGIAPNGDIAYANSKGIFLVTRIIRR